MVAPPSAAELRAAVVKWLPRHAFYPGWQTRTRPYPIDVNGLLQHHTGGPFTHSRVYLDFLFNVGRPSEGIPGPLCNFATDDLGVVWVGSRLRTNNAGPGDIDILNKIIGESYPGYVPPELNPGRDDYDDGNGHYWGNEIMYPGTVPMRPLQYESAVLVGAMVCDLFGWSALSVAAHREHTERKNDPYGVKLYDMRRDVRAALAKGPSWRLDDMNEAELVALFRAAAAGSTGNGRALRDSIRQILVGGHQDGRPTEAGNWLAHAVLSPDGVVDAPPSAEDADTNKWWQPIRVLQETAEGAVYQIPNRLDAVEAVVAEIKGIVEQLQIGAIDYDLLATKVVERLTTTTELGFRPSTP